MIKRANRESRPLTFSPHRTPSSACRTFNRVTPPFRNHPRRPRGVAVATTAAPETRLADLHARGNTRPPLSTWPVPQDQLERFSSFGRPPPLHHPYCGSIYTRFNLAISPPFPPPSSHRRFVDDAAVSLLGVCSSMVRKNRIKDVPNNAWTIYARNLSPLVISRISVLEFFEIWELRIEKKS